MEKKISKELQNEVKRVEKLETLGHENIQKLINLLNKNKIIGCGVVINNETKNKYAKFEFDKLDISLNNKDGMIKVDNNDIIISQDLKNIFVNLKSQEIKHFLLNILNNSFINDKLSLKDFINIFELQKLDIKKVYKKYSKIINKIILDTTIASGGEVEIKDIYSRKNEDDKYSLFLLLNKGFFEISNDKIYLDTIDELKKV